MDNGYRIELVARCKLCYINSKTRLMMHQNTHAPRIWMMINTKSSYCHHQLIGCSKRTMHIGFEYSHWILYWTLLGYDGTEHIPRLWKGWTGARWSYWADVMDMMNY
ncbi:unnamed protein product [Absidia cylindrospora]